MEAPSIALAYKYLIVLMYDRHTRRVTPNVTPNVGAQLWVFALRDFSYRVTFDLDNAGRVRGIEQLQVLAAYDNGHYVNQPPKPSHGTGRSGLKMLANPACLCPW
jgi:hypothetical protein